MKPSRFLSFDYNFIFCVCAVDAGVVLIPAPFPYVAEHVVPKTIFAGRQTRHRILGRARTRIRHRCLSLPFPMALSFSIASCSVGKKNRSEPWLDS